MRKLRFKAVILTDGESYLIHGSNSETAAEMFKTMQPIWSFDPATETAHFVELEVTLPEMENVAELEAAALDYKFEAERAADAD